MTAKNFIYQIKNLKHAYNGRPILDIADFSVERAGIVGLMGPNGSGKSTLLRFLGFIEKPAEGEIRYNGKIEYPFSNAVKSHVALLPQTPYLMKRSVSKNIAYGLVINKKLSDRRIRERVHEALDMVGLDVKAFAGRQWSELSGGEAQRAALAARLALKPDVLLLDEPTASVDAASIQRIKDASIQARHEWGTTIIIASHDRQWLLDICDQAVHLFNGRIFDSAYENILFGPWYPENNGRWKKKTADLQSIIVSRPPHSSAAAVLDPRRVSLHPLSRPVRTDHHCMTGLISQLTLEKNNNNVLVSVQIGNLYLTACASDSPADSPLLFPGQNIKLSYHPDSVHWI